MLCLLGETCKFIGYSPHIQQPATANLYRKSYTQLLNAAAFWLQPAVKHFDVSYIQVTSAPNKRYQQLADPCQNVLYRHAISTIWLYYSHVKTTEH